MRKCSICKHAETSVGAYTGITYIECSLERKIAETMTIDQLMEAIRHPDEFNYCNFSGGTPKDMGVTFDD